MRAWFHDRRIAAPYYRALRLERQGRLLEAEDVLLALTVVTALSAAERSSPLLRPRVAIAITLLAVGALVFAVAVRHDLDRLGPQVRASGLARAALWLAGLGIVAEVVAIFVAALT